MHRGQSTRSFARYLSKRKASRCWARPACACVPYTCGGGCAFASLQWEEMNSRLSPREITSRQQMQKPSAIWANLFLHSLADDDGAAQPIDVRPVPGQMQAFEATLDYSMAGFHIQATASPPDACQVSQMSTAAIMLDPGDSTLSRSLRGRHGRKGSPA